CRISGETIFATTGKPMSLASFAASAADVATPSFGTGIPYASATALASGAVSDVRPSLLTRSRTWRTCCWFVLMFVSSDHVVGAQRRDVVLGVPELRQHLVG